MITQYTTGCSIREAVKGTSMITNIIYQKKANAYVITHSVEDRKTVTELEAEGTAFVREHQLGECMLAAHLDNLNGDHVHVVPVHPMMGSREKYIAAGCRFVNQ